MTLPAFLWMLTIIGEVGKGSAAEALTGPQVGRGYAKVYKALSLIHI